MLLKIKSTDLHGQEYEESFIFEKEILEDCYKYHYTDEYSKNTVSVYDTYVVIYRKGIINTKQTFKKEETTKSIYVKSGLKMDFLIYTKEIEVSNYKIFLNYDILSNSEIINTIKLEIMETGISS